MSGHVDLMILQARLVSWDIRSCLGEPLGHSHGPYMTILNFLSIELLRLRLALGGVDWA
jgi:hypothetical protein